MVRDVSSRDKLSSGVYGLARPGVHEWAAATAAGPVAGDVRQRADAAGRRLERVRSGYAADSPSMAKTKDEHAIGGNRKNLN